MIFDKSQKRGNIVYLLCLCCILFLASCTKYKPSNEKETTTNAAIDSTLIIPTFNLITIYDSSTIKREGIQKDGLVLIKYFSPDCDHCQNEAKMYFSKKDSLQNIKTLWVAGNWNTLQMLEEFYENYQVEDLKPLAMGIERDNELLVHYRFSGVPFSAIYKNNQLVKTYTGKIDFDELIAMNNEQSHVP